VQKLLVTQNDEINALRNRIAELEEEVRQLRADMVPTDATFLDFLSKHQMKLLLGIYSRPIADYSYLDRITEQGDRYNRYTDINHEALRNRVSIWKLRQKMREHGIEIKTWRGIGYYLDDENKEKLRGLLNTSAERVNKTGES
jgi:DNA-binding response OmpR family regulator